MKINFPVITTIIPTYKRPDMLKKAIQSVLNQSYINFQICVYDNASGDETSQVVHRLMKQDSRINYYCHKNNIGAIKNFEFGLKKVKTNFFNFLSDDDIILPNFFKIAIENFQKYPETYFFAGSSLTIRSSGEIFHIPLLSWEREGLYRPPDGILNMCNGNHPTWTGIIFRKEVMDEIGTLDIDTKRASDLDFELRIASIRPYFISKTPCSLFLSHSGASCKIENANDAWDGWLKMISNLENDSRIPFEIKRTTSALLLKSMQKRLFILGLKQIDNNNFSDVKNTLNILENNPSLKNPYNWTLKIIYTICRHFKLGHLTFIYMYKIFKSIKKVSLKKINTMYKDIKKYL